jgi:hypothetical protein
MRKASIPRRWIIAMLLLLSAGIIYIGFEAVGKEALIESALFQKNPTLLQHIGMMPQTQHRSGR